MATLTPVQAKVGGAAVTFVAASASGDALPVGDRTAVLVRNQDTTAKTVTVVVPGNTRFGLPQPDVTASVPAGATYLFGPFPRDLADPNDRLAHITYSAVTSVTVAAISV